METLPSRPSDGATIAGHLPADLQPRSAALYETAGKPPEDQIRELLTALLAYAAQVSPEQREAMSAAVRESAYRPAEEAMMTIAEQWKAEGHTEGRQKGRVEGKIEDKQFVLTRQLDRKFGLSNNERALISATTDADKLDAALDAVVDYPDKASILALLT